MVQALERRIRKGEKGMNRMGRLKLLWGVIQKD